MYINVLIETKVKSNDMTFTYHVPDDMLYDNIIGKLKQVGADIKLIGFESDD